VFGLEAGGARRALDRVQPVHGKVTVRVSLRQLAPAGIVGRQAQKSGMGYAGEKVRVEGNDHVGILQAILGVVVVAEGRLRCRVG